MKCTIVRCGAIVEFAALLLLRRKRSRLYVLVVGVEGPQRTSVPLTCKLCMNTRVTCLSDIEKSVVHRRELNTHGNARRSISTNLNQRELSRREARPRDRRCRTDSLR